MLFVLISNRMLGYGIWIHSSCIVNKKEIVLGLPQTIYCLLAMLGLCNIIPWQRGIWLKYTQSALSLWETNNYIHTPTCAQKSSGFHNTYVCVKSNG